jgi:hypothetical protein
MSNIYEESSKVNQHFEFTGLDGEDLSLLQTSVNAQALTKVRPGKPFTRAVRAGAVHIPVSRDFGGRDPILLHQGSEKIAQ